MSDWYQGGRLGPFGIGDFSKHNEILLLLCEMLGLDE